MTNLIFGAAFAAGLATIGWIGAGYLSGHVLALAVTLLIAVFYLAGAWELVRFHRSTRALGGALQALNTAPASLDDWLQTLPAGLRIAVRQRVEGLRAGLPGPALAPYLTGSLVLLGMLGTFLGMVVTLQGTGTALLGAEGLQAIRDALAAPVRGLGLAFGTSVAGVGASAALGLMAALARRERLQTAQRLDTAMAATLRSFTPQHQREASLRLMEQQAGLMPELVERIGACMTALESQQAALAERMAAEQARFHAGTETAYTALAASVERTLTASATESARHAGEAIQPAVQAALAGLARESAGLQAAQAEQVRAQLDGIASRFGEATASVATQWTSALATHRQASETTTSALKEALDGFTHTFDARSTALAAGLTERLEQQAETLSTRWGEALSQQAQHGEQLAAQHELALKAAAQGMNEAHIALQSRFAEQEEARQAAWTASLHTVATALQSEWQQVGERSVAQWQGLGNTLASTAEGITRQIETQAQSTLREISGLIQVAAEAPRAAAQVVGDLHQKLADFGEATVGATTQWTNALASHQQASEASTNALREALDGFTHAFDTRSTQLADGLAQRLEQQAHALSSRWGEVLALQMQSGEQLAAQNEQVLQAAAQGMEQAHTALQSRIAEQEEARQAAWTASLHTLAATLQSEWQQAGERSAAQWQGLGDTLTRTSESITRQLETQAQSTLGEIGALMQAASEAPRAAAEVIGELRQKLTDSMARDNAMLEERSRILETLSALLEAVNHASAEQRGAIDALVATTSGLMESASSRFTETLDAQTGRIDTVAAQLTGSAEEVASLGEAFGAGVQHFGEANEQLVAQLQRIEAALTKSLARSDEQLDYYVAQAREVIELSTGAQKQIIDELRQLSAEREA